MIASIPLWLCFTIAAGISMTVFDMSFKNVGIRINGLAFSCIVAFISSLFSLIMLFFFGHFENMSFLIPTKSELKWVILAGIAAAFTNMSFFYMFSKGGEVSTCIPLVAAINILSISVISVLFFCESIPTHKVVGILMATISIFLLSK